MAARKSAPVERPDEDAVRAEATRQLVSHAKENPWHLFTAEELGSILGVSRNAMTSIKNAGAPFVAGKSNPGLLLAWIGAHAADVEKVRSE